MKSIALKPHEVMTTPQACKALGVTRQTIYAWMQKGLIRPWMRVGGASWLFVREEIFRIRNNEKKSERRKVTT